MILTPMKFTVKASCSFIHHAPGIIQFEFGGIQMACHTGGHGVFQQFGKTFCMYPNLSTVLADIEHFEFGGDGFRYIWQIGLAERQFFS